jgi:hypothetical protein
MVERPPDPPETPDPDIEQDAGVPGVKFPASDESFQGFEDSEDEDEIRRKAEADDTIAPGSMPPGDESA